MSDKPFDYEPESALECHERLNRQFGPGTPIGIALEKMKADMYARNEQAVDDVITGRAIIARHIVVASSYGRSEVERLPWHKLDAVAGTGYKASVETR